MHATLQTFLYKIMNISVPLAVFKRNFVSYFANPTGYLFICVFVLMCAASAFWPPDFFNNNLANLDQLSWGIQILGFRFGFSIIMLVFIPSITMSIWAEERRQGTDELLLTIPAGDFEIVLGKYLAAVAIFSVALGVFADLQLRRAQVAGRSGRGLVPGHVFRLLADRAGDAGRGHGGLVSDQQFNGELYPGRFVQCAAGFRLGGRSAFRPDVGRAA